MNTTRFQLNITFEALHELMGLPEEVEIVSAHTDWSRGVLEFDLIAPYTYSPVEGQERHRIHYSTPDIALHSPGEMLAREIGLDKESVADNA